MSSIKQELAAILMDYTDDIPDQAYKQILERLGQIPDHKDPKKAIEIQQELNEANSRLEILDDTQFELEECKRDYEILNDEFEDQKIELYESKKNFEYLSKFFTDIIGNKPTIHGDSMIIFNITSKSSDYLKKSRENASDFIKVYKEWMIKTMNNYESSSIEPGQHDDSEKEENIVQEDIDSNIEEFKQDYSEEEMVSILRKAVELKINGDYSEAIIEFEKLLPKNNNDTTDFDAEVIFRLGMCHEGTQEWEKAIGYFYWASLLNPKKFYTKSLNKIGIINEQEFENYENAENAYKKAIRFASKNSDNYRNPLYNYAELLKKLFRIEESISQYINLLRKSPNDEIAKEDLIQLLRYTFKFKYNIKNIAFSLEETYNNSSYISSLKMSINSVIAMSKSCKKYNDSIFTKIVNKYNRKINNSLTTMLFHDKFNISHDKSTPSSKKNTSFETSFIIYSLKEQEWNRTIKQNPYYKNSLIANYKSLGFP